MTPSASNNLISNRLPPYLRLPAIVTWNRLEPRPRTTTFERSLRAEVRDALWMLTRQWQFGEFQGEDAGTAIFAKVQLQTTPINRYAQRGGKAVAYDNRLPLETRVEREAIPLDLLLSIQMGQHWLNLLRHQGLEDKYRELYRAAYPITLPAMPEGGNATLFSHRPAWQLRAAATGRAVNGGQLYQNLLSGIKAEDVTAGTLQVDALDKPQVAQTAQDFLDWFQRLFNQPQSRDDFAWAPKYLEYQFACSAPKLEGYQTILQVNEYYQGYLDWYSFELDPNARARLQDKEGQSIKDDLFLETLSFIPTPVRFAGMPNVRWWEFEDQLTDLGDIDTHTTDVAKLLLMEFGLAYGNDWSIIPYIVPVGSLCEIKALVVTDVFGLRTLIQPAGRGRDQDWQRWTMFNLSSQSATAQLDNRLFLPPTIGKLIESPPIELVNFLRDEMANMVWAIESRIPDDLGGGMNGYEAATDLLNLLKRIAPPSSPELIPVETDALIGYRLGNKVPENWIPFIPVHVLGSNREIQLQRAAMSRIIRGLPTITVQPRGAILQPDLGATLHYFVHPEEIPRVGATVVRTYQRTRWYDGSTYLWLGRRKQVGRGEGSSGLKFDQIEPMQEETDDSSR